MNNPRVTLGELYDELMFMDGFDDCVIGVVEKFGHEPCVAYSYDQVIEKLINQGMNREQAEEFHSFNQVGAYVGEATPCFLSTHGIGDPL